jgi:uncharacterized protein DUF6165
MLIDPSLWASASSGQYTATVNLTVQISPGEFLDKLTILEIKAERIEDAAKKKNVMHELETLRRAWAAARVPQADVHPLVAELRAVNEALWEIEDRIRLKESRREFDQEFVELARSVYRTNDRRAEIKRALNMALGSDLIEEKSYPAGGDIVAG